MKLLIMSVLSACIGLAYAEPMYVGPEKCAKMCHKSEKQGSQLPIWQKSGHAGAYKTLATPHADSVAKKAGIKTAAQKSEKCLKCHITGAGAKKEAFAETYALDDGVSCEACHGPGKDYMKLNVMKDKKLSLAAGLIEPEEKVCLACHNAESPTFKGFDFKEMTKKISHKKPK